MVTICLNVAINFVCSLATKLMILYLMRGATRLEQEDGEINGALRAATIVILVFLVLEIVTIVFVFLSAFEFKNEAFNVINQLEEPDNGVPVMILLYD